MIWRLKNLKKKSRKKYDSLVYFLKISAKYLDIAEILRIFDLNRVI